MVLPSTSGATDNVHILMNTTLVSDVDVDISNSSIPALVRDNSRGLTSTTPVKMPIGEEEADDTEEIEQEEENYTNLKNKMTLRVCDPDVCREVYSRMEWICFNQRK